MLRMGEMLGRRGSKETARDGSGSRVPPPALETRPSRRGRRPWYRREHPLLLMVPTLAMLTLIVLVPLAVVILTSFMNITESNIAHWLAAPFTWLRNYTSALTGPNVLGVSALQSIWISLAFSLITTAVGTPIAFLAALTVHHRSRGRTAIRSIYLIPYAIPCFVTAILARIIFLNQSGLLDVVLSDLHIASRNTYWLIGPNAFWAMTITDIWASWPLIYLLLLAGLAAIPKEQLEAAIIDGASTWQRLRYVVIPRLTGVYSLAVLLSTFNHFGNFTLPYVMFGGVPPTSADTLPVNIYFRAFSSFDFGVASATAIITILVLGIPGLIYMRTTRLAENPMKAA
jgi:multiple sugar transport system permease protein